MTTIQDVLEGRARWCVENRFDCLDVLRELPGESIDAAVMDPPYGLGTKEPTVAEIIAYLDGADLDTGGDFMGKKWALPPVTVWKEVFRVLKPGGHLLAFAGTRTFDIMSIGIRAAGFENRDTIAAEFGPSVLHWVHGQGFPKSLDLSKAADKSAGAKRPIVGTWDKPGRGKRSPEQKFGLTADKGEITEPATAAAAALQGWGSALKPAWEPILVFRKPPRGTLIANVLAHGTGGMNIDACRVPHASAADLEQHAAGVAAIKERGGSMDGSWKNSSDLSGASDVTAAGRWPANVVLVHSDACERVGVRKVKAAPSWNDNRPPSAFTGSETSLIRHADVDGTETVEEWRCSEGCPVAAMDRQSGDSSGTDRVHHNGAFKSVAKGAETARTSFGHSDSGGASRYFSTFAGEPFFYLPKADREQRERGCEHLPESTGAEMTNSADGAARLESPRTGAGRGGGRKNVHPTVKPLKLMEWLCRLVCPPGGVVLDPYCGSGTTVVAALAHGFRAIGIERDERFCEIARARIVGDAPLFNRAGGAR